LEKNDEVGLSGSAFGWKTSELSSDSEGKYYIMYCKNGKSMTIYHNYAFNMYAGEDKKGNGERYMGSLSEIAKGFCGE
jgi:hypothetical protein